jgi:hypothetical protein
VEHVLDAFPIGGRAAMRHIAPGTRVRPVGECDPI